MPTAKKKTLKSSVSIPVKNETVSEMKVSGPTPGHPVGCKCLSCTIRSGGFLKGKGFTPILIALLVIAVFFIGILVDRVMYLQSQNSGTYQAGNQAQPTTAGPQEGQKVNVSVGHLPALGNKNAKVKIVEFADLRCPFCDQFYKGAEQSLINDYVKPGKVAFYFRHYAFLGPSSIVAANAAECANEQGKFWDMHNYLYENQPDESDTSMYNVTDLTNIAGQLGMNTTQFQTCLSSNKYQKNVDADLADGQKAGVNGTPTFFINGQMLVGALPYTSIKTAVDCALNNNSFSVNSSTGDVTCNK